ncbi:MAG TPA: hypothetical protein VI912_00490 [Candidatus Bilamarchaeaceae archaeon]|nr:hypothetical protein [Candidatus Bilamarchaeaceae archaeon]
MTPLQLFIRKNSVRLIIINAALLLFVFYFGTFEKLDISDIFILLLVVGTNVLFYFSFGNEKEEKDEIAEDETEELSEKTKMVTDRREKIIEKLNDKDKKMFAEFEEEIRKIPLEQRTDKKAGEMLERIKKKYESS